MKHLTIFLRGILMGAADVVPGVSGGTVAMITGIYERLINAIANISKQALPALRSGGVLAAWKAVDGTFLIVLAAGIGTSFLTIANVISWALTNYPQVLWAFFFGLVVASSYIVGLMVGKWNIGNSVALVVAVVVTFWITSAAPAATPDDLWFVFVSGMIAISAMILPGISGSFMLVLMSKYAFMLEALRTFNIPVIIVFISGCAVGILTASRVISWLFKRYHDLAIAIITGIMIGSLNKIWPWKETLTTRLDSHGELVPVTQANIWPNAYQAASGEPSLLAWAILAAILGLLVVFGIEYLQKRYNQK